MFDTFAAEVYALLNVVSMATDLGVLWVMFEMASQLLAEAMVISKVDSSP